MCEVVLSVVFEETQPTTSSGGAFNPAVALGLSIASRFEGLYYALCVSVSNLIGGAVSAVCFKIVSKNILSEPETVVLGESAPLNT